MRTHRRLKRASKIGSYPLNITQQEVKINMNETLEKAIAAIEAQQPEERSAVWMVGEQLKDILREEPKYAALILTDLENKSMSITECEKQIHAFADKHKKGNFACVIPTESDRIIREFYGLPQRGAGTIDLTDFM